MDSLDAYMDRYYKEYPYNRSDVIAQIEGKGISVYCKQRLRPVVLPAKEMSS